MPFASHTPDRSRAVVRDPSVVDARVVTSSNHNASTQSYLCFDWMRRLEWVIVTGHHSSRGPPIERSGASGKTNVSNVSSNAKTPGFPGTTNARVVEDAEEDAEDAEDDAFSLSRARRIEGMDGRTNERRAVERRDATRWCRCCTRGGDCARFLRAAALPGLEHGKKDGDEDDEKNDADATRPLARALLVLSRPS